VGPIQGTTSEGNAANGRQSADLILLRCPITGRPCRGDLTRLCKDYGCARKGGLSPHSEENV
jgi:hypothetical protein